MNKGAKLLDANHVLRHVPHTKVMRHEDGTVFGIFPEAFAPRPVDDNALSVNWLEHFESSHQNNLDRTIALIREIRGIGANSTCIYAYAKVIDIKNAASTHSSPVRIVFDGNSPNVSHSLIKDISSSDSLLHSILATEVFTNIVSNF